MAAVSGSVLKRIDLLSIGTDWQRIREGPDNWWGNAAPIGQERRGRSPAEEAYSICIALLHIQGLEQHH